MPAIWRSWSLLGWSKHPTAWPSSTGRVIEVVPGMGIVHFGVVFPEKPAGAHEDEKEWWVQW